MSNNHRYKWDDQALVRHNITAGDVIGIGDNLGVVTAKAVPASDFTYAGGTGGTYVSLAAAQEAFKAVFLGNAEDASRSTDLFTTVGIRPKGVFEFDSASASYAVGDLVGPAGNAVDTTYHLENQKVAAVAAESMAIGRVERATSSATKVLVRLFSKVLRGSSGSGADYNLSFAVTAAEIANGNFITGFTPGHAFELISLDAYVTSALTGSTKTVTLNAEIDTVDVTGGVVTVASANAALGTRVAGSAITAVNRGTSASVIDFEASAVTAFTGGVITIVARIRNLA